MTIREATERDTPEIVSLMRLSLGESLTPKSEQYWNWKHVQNPFGRSVVILAEDNGQIVGLRAFMRWDWNFNGQTFRALRAVDTATHPAYQGKGIFKKLTLSLVDKCTADGYDFIFNTPNEKSRPGYLKMGWDSLGKTSIRIKPVITSFLFGREAAKANSSGTELNDRVWSGIDGLLESYKRDCIGRFHTNYSKDYLVWRYKTVPVATYHSIMDPSPEARWLMIYRMKEGGSKREMRITDLFVDPGHFDFKKFRIDVKNVIRDQKPHFVSISGNLMPSVNSILNRLMFLPSLSLGPILTARTLRQGPLRFWHSEDRIASLGDLELF